jgi:fibro-slime domain-containing protein
MSRKPLVWLSLLILSCSAGSKPGAQVRPGEQPGGAGASGGSGLGVVPIGGGVGIITCDPNDPASTCGPNAPPPLNCGDGMLTSDEACDDGNLNSGDGCSGNCLAVERGFSCNPPGKACRQIARCGDGIVAESEACDDGNAADGDGCSTRCRLEIGFKCSGMPSACSKTVCGDKIKEGAEGCDDGNAVPFDGCSSTCQAEPDCSMSGGCKSACGDGLVIGEECDDANVRDGDGCSSTCKLEAGFTCMQANNCEKLNDACILRVPVVYRDLGIKHPDVEPTCKGTMDGLAATPKLVNATLSGGVPTATAAATAACITSLDTWYSDKGAPAIVRDIVLFDNGKGGFVNRYGAMGEQWESQAKYTNPRFCGNGDTMCLPGGTFPGCDFDATVDTCFFPCPSNLGSATDSCAAVVTPGVKYDGTPLFFPLDDQKETTSDPWIEAKVPTQYGYNWEYEDQIVPRFGAPHVAGAKTHNFHFTTQVTYWFKYDATATARLDFTGDDDVWVFVNDRLAVDLGGVHQPVDGSVTISAATAATYGLTDGNVYKLNIFHAERKKESSSFRLTLAGFSAATTDCTPVCGDSVVSAGEECDDGKNDGGYGECAAGCKLGEFCGDGMKQGNEDCDDGNTFDGDACPSSCRILVVK